LLLLSLLLQLLILLERKTFQGLHTTVCSCKLLLQVLLLLLQLLSDLAPPDLILQLRTARQHLLQLCLPLLVLLTRRLRGVQPRQGLNIVGCIAACKQLLKFIQAGGRGRHSHSVSLVLLLLPRLLLLLLLLSSNRLLLQGKRTPPPAGIWGTHSCSSRRRLLI
jgi:hypothetical protein